MEDVLMWDFNAHTLITFLKLKHRGKYYYSVSDNIK